MSDPEELSERLNRALDALAAKAEAAAGAPADQSDRVAELEAENRDLRQRLESLHAAREQDLAELDQLLAQLKPLIEETA